MNTAETIYWQEAKPVILRLLSVLGASTALIGPMSLIVPAGLSLSASASPFVAAATKSGACTCRPLARERSETKTHAITY